MPTSIDSSTGILCGKGAERVCKSTGMIQTHHIITCQFEDHYMFNHFFL